MIKYIDGTLIKVGDVFTDGSSGREDVRLKNRAKVLYVDKFVLVWYPLNEFTNNNIYKSQTWAITQDPKKIEISELTEEELEFYNQADFIVNGEKRT